MKFEEPSPTCPPCAMTKSHRSAFRRRAPPGRGAPGLCPSAMAQKETGTCPGLRCSRGPVDRSTGRRNPSAALRRGRGPALDQGVVVDGLALRLLVLQLALGRDVAVLRRLVVPELGRLLLVELRAAVALHA